MRLNECKYRIEITLFPYRVCVVILVKSEKKYTRAKTMVDQRELVHQYGKIA